MLNESVAEPLKKNTMAGEPHTDLANLRALEIELDWLARVIDCVICQYLKHEGHDKHWVELPLPEHEEETSVYGAIIAGWSLDRYERLALVLSIAPHLRPQILDIFFGLNQLHNRAFTEFGGVANSSFSGFLPTAQTLAFLICGNNPLWRHRFSTVVSAPNRLMAEQVLSLEGVDTGMPSLGGVLSISEQWLHYFLTAEPVRPELSSAFPAQAITTALDWDDLILEDSVMDQIIEIKAWLDHGQTLMSKWNLQGKIKPGYRALFFGAPGTGKTLTATLLAKSTEREIYRVDLSMLVSKYIGETEKNLSKVFDAASYKRWILFFDEADALFGKRTVATTSNDRHANQLTGYLLQRIEDFPGVVILSSNLRANIDEAFTRRFQSMIHFTMPSAEERLQLWTNAFADSCTLHEDVDLSMIADKYEMAGGAIINVLRYCALAAISRQSNQVSNHDILNGIRREFRKDNKTLAV